MDDPSSRPARRRGLVLLGVVFVLGMVCGATLFHLGRRYLPQPLRGFGPDGPHPGMGLERLTHELSLDVEQKRKIEAILEGRRNRMQQFLAQGRSEIRDVLRPDQQAIFDALPHDHGSRHGWRPERPPGPPSDAPQKPPSERSQGSPEPGPGHP